MSEVLWRISANLPALSGQRANTLSTRRRRAKAAEKWPAESLRPTAASRKVCLATGCLQKRRDLQYRVASAELDSLAGSALSRPESAAACGGHVALRGAFRVAGNRFGRWRGRTVHATGCRTFVNGRVLTQSRKRAPPGDPFWMTRLSCESVLGEAGHCPLDVNVGGSWAMS